jgi:thiosulfate/3-mercaptopyruvate sulfurtransferase
MSDAMNTSINEMLATSDWLASHLNNPEIRIVDARKGDGYKESHVVGAVCYDGTPFLREDGDVIGAESFAALMSGLGISNDTTVIAYDDGNNLFAGRLWWVLNYYGHAQVKVLDGGWDLWSSERRPVDNARIVPRAARFEVRQNDVWIADSAYVQASIGDPERVILDVRGDDEWSRMEASDTTPPGHIPGAVHLVWSDVIEPDTKRFKPVPALRRMFGEIGVSTDMEVITYCQGGIRAAHTALALKLAGYGHVRNYEGSWAAWSRTSFAVEPYSAAHPNGLIGKSKRT